jgi:hypothetical protein
LELAFDSKNLRDLCEQESYAVQSYGAAVAAQLRHRIADMMAAISPLVDLIVSRRRESEHNTACMILDLCDGFEIEFCANHVSNPSLLDGRVDWEKASRYRMQNVKDGLRC